MITSKKLLIGLAVLAVSVTNAQSYPDPYQGTTFHMFEFDPEQGSGVRRQVGLRGRKSDLHTDQNDRIDLTYRKTDREVFTRCFAVDASSYKGDCFDGKQPD